MFWFKKDKTPAPHNTQPAAIIFCSHHLEGELSASRLSRPSQGIFMGKRSITGEFQSRFVRIVITGEDAGFYTTVFKNRAASLVNTEIIFFGTAGCIHSSVMAGDVVTCHIPCSWKFSNPDSLFCDILAGATSQNVSVQGVKKSYDSCRFNHWHGSVATCRPGDFINDTPPLPETTPRIYCTDTYSGYAARICCKAGIPFAVIKGISHIKGREHQIDTVGSNMRAVIHGSYLILDYLVSGRSLSQWLYSGPEATTSGASAQMA